MKSFFYKPVLFAAFAAASLSSCINDDDYDVPVQAECIETTLVKTKEPQDIIAVDAPVKYTGDDIIEAYVVSTDVAGNFFKTISLQTLDGSFGFSVPIDVTTVYPKFEPGRKVMIKLKDTYVDKEFGSLRIGALFNNQVGRLSLDDYEMVLNRTCTVVSEDSLVNNLTIAQTKNDVRINTLIELDNVQFIPDAHGKTYYDAGNAIGGATNYNLVDAAGNTIIFRTSSFAAFASQKVPNGVGKVRGVLTKFNSDYQFIARDINDIKIENVPGTETPEEPGDPNNPVVISTTALGGTATVFSGTRTENFESYTVETQAFPEYINDRTEGTRYWRVRDFSGSNNYIEMSAFASQNSPGLPSKAYFFVPVNFDAANSVSFDKQIRFMSGQALKVFYVTEANYPAKSVINANTFVDITSGFTNLVYPATGQSQNNFTTAGTYQLPASVTGNGYIVFEYTGTTSVTTTIQIDNISIQ